MLSSIEYSKHSWHICADLKVIAVLVGLQAGYTKFCCFLCQWDSRDRKKALHQEGLMKNFVKAMDCGGSGFQYLRLKFPKVSEAKIKEGIFVGLQVRQLMKDPVFESKLTKKEAAAWTSFKELAKNFLGNHKAKNYRQIVNNLLKGLQNHGMQHVVENPFLALPLRILP
ncbi:hypothetical protein AVEN_263281-1 [Araneus ventricosus]|uniref:Uncharacterized protein n=1 Tax=Araneus ventricosus TaxID=182803 RepID=A0A4Y2HH96_ARAVE|nr:hypothetical protein AVEN_263281-1 [Araneus ventricosus]